MRLQGFAPFISITLLATLSCREPLPPNATGSAPSAQRVSASEVEYEIVDLGVLDGLAIVSLALLNDDGVVVVRTGFGQCASRTHRWENGTWTDLGGLGSCGAVPSGLNQRGDVVGTSPTPDGSAHAFLWSGGVMHDLGTLGGAESQAWSVNNRGEVVGDAMLPDGSTHAFLWSGGQMIDLGTLEGSSASSATHINDRGDIAGWSEFPPGAGEFELRRRSFVWRRGVMTDVGQLHPGIRRDFSSPGALAPNGSVMGTAAFGNITGHNEAYVWHNGILSALGRLPDHFVSEPVDALDHNWVVGHSRRFPTSPNPWGVVWREGGPPEDLGRLALDPNCTRALVPFGEYVRDVNGARQVVGRSGPHRLGEFGPAHGFVWQDGVMHDLGTLGGCVSDAHAINEQGTIAGVARDADGRLHVVLWRPVPRD